MKKILKEEDFLTVIRQLYGKEKTEEEIRKDAKEVYQGYLTDHSFEKAKARLERRSSQH